MIFDEEGAFALFLLQKRRERALFSMLRCKERKGGLSQVTQNIVTGVAGELEENVFEALIRLARRERHFLCDFRRLSENQALSG